MKSGGTLALCPRRRLDTYPLMVGNGNRCVSCSLLFAVLFNQLSDLFIGWRVGQVVTMLTGPLHPPLIDDPREFEGLAHTVMPRFLSHRRKASSIAAVAVLSSVRAIRRTRRQRLRGKYRLVAVRLSVTFGSMMSCATSELWLPVVLESSGKNHRWSKRLKTI